MTSAPPPVSPAVSAPREAGFAPVGPAFLDPNALIELSAAQRFIPPAWPALFLAMGLIMGSAALTGSSGGPAELFVLVGLMTIWSVHFAVRRAAGRGIAAEVQAVDALEELVMLRRWTEAADLAQRILTRPMYLRERRLSALRSLGAILSRYHRFSDARIVYDYLLSDEVAAQIDSSTSHSIRVSRAIGLLREDRLVDADKAMNDLRREVNRTRDEVRRHRGPEAAAQIQSAGLVLLELYRDVKTRHYEEAVAGFEPSLPILREQLGMRVADAWALVAIARDGLGHSEPAQLAYSNATALAPLIELQRRYPEFAALADKYTATDAPKAGRS